MKLLDYKRGTKVQNRNFTKKEEPFKDSANRTRRPKGKKKLLHGKQQLELKKRYGKIRGTRTVINLTSGCQKNKFSVMGRKRSGR